MFNKFDCFRRKKYNNTGNTESIALNPINPSIKLGPKCIWFASTRKRYLREIKAANWQRAINPQMETSANSCSIYIEIIISAAKCSKLTEK